MKQIYQLILLSCLFWACNPMEDINNELDKNEKQPSAQFQYTLTSADYSSISAAALKDAKTSADSALARSVATLKAMPSDYANKYVPAVLAKLHPSLKESSVCLLTYTTQQKTTTNVAIYGTAPSHTLTPANYALADAFVQSNLYFSPAHPFSAAANTILNQQFPSASIGDLKRIQYKQSDVDVAGNTPYTSGAYYRLDATQWNKVEEVYLLNDQDYLSMGITDKQFNSSTAKSQDYLPVFLKSKYAYATANTKKIIAFNQGRVRAEEYILKNNAWAYQGSVLLSTETNQFIRTSENWFFDPTIRFNMINADYFMIVDAVKNDPEKSKYVDRGTAEYYYGASSFRDNFDLRVIKRITGDFTQSEFTSLPNLDAQIKLTYTRLEQSIGILLSKKYPTAVAQVNGIDVFYEVTVSTYEDNLSNGKHTVVYQCTKSAPNPVFTFVKRF